MNLADEVRRIAAADPSALSRPMSHNEDYRLPLHYAVLKNRPEMVALLLELGADPLATGRLRLPGSRVRDRARRRPSACSKRSARAAALRTCSPPLGTGRRARLLAETGSWTRAARAPACCT